MRTFRLHVLGALPAHGSSGELCIFAEYLEARAVARVTMTTAQVSALQKQARDLRGFIESGFPEFEERALRTLGSTLFELVVRESVRELFAAATAQGKSLPLEVLFESNEIASWPWEYMFDTGKGLYVCREFHPVSRKLLNLLPDTDEARSSNKLKVLIIKGAAADDPEVSVDEERELLGNIFGALLDGGRFDVSLLGGVAARDLVARLQESHFDIVHFIGHSAFDLARQEGFLRFVDAAGKKSKLYANDLASLLVGSGTRLVFLNGCETARAAVADQPARSSIAAALVARGIPAVIANQFSVPDNGAHFFATAVYRALFNGKTLGEAVRMGRLAMSIEGDSKFFDWGIPVLYAKAPNRELFAGLELESFTARVESLDTEAALESMGAAAPEVRSAPSVRSASPRSIAMEGVDRVKPTQVVALVDIDARAGFLPALVEAANRVQTYYEFRVVYMPIPAGYIRSKFDGQRTEPQLFVPHLTTHVEHAPKTLGVDAVCFITRNMLASETADGEFWNYFLVGLPANPRVSFVSTCDLRGFAKKAGCSFARATFMVCLSGVLYADGRWGLREHAETMGCPFDFCEERADIVVGLKKLKFDHEECRSKVRDAAQLAAVDALIALRDAPVLPTAAGGAKSPPPRRTPRASPRTRAAAPRKRTLR